LEPETATLARGRPLPLSRFEICMIGGFELFIEAQKNTQATLDRV
jgi:hypothetical protein